MLYDPNWKAPEVKLEPWQKVLLEAADLIERYGWVQGRLGHSQIGFCAVGALQAAATTNVDAAGIYHSAFNKMQRAITASGNGINIPSWNDACGRTKEEVIAKFREASAG